MIEEENKFHLSNALKETIREKVDTGKNQSIFVGIVDENDTDYYCYGNTAKIICLITFAGFLSIIIMLLNCMQNCL